MHDLGQLTTTIEAKIVWMTSWTTLQRSGSRWNSRIKFTGESPNLVPSADPPSRCFKRSFAVLSVSWRERT
eukprot:5624253-Amphidinium_carterae.1